MPLSLNEKEKAILMQTYREQSISRAQLAKCSSLKIASFYRHVDSLLRKGYLISQDDNTRYPTEQGRPSQLLSLNPSIGCSLAVSLWRSSCHVALFDFSGKAVCEEELPFHEIPATKVFYSRLQHAIDACFSTSGIAPDSLLGISIANVGVLDDSEERIVKLTYNQYSFVQELRVPKMLRERYMVPVIIQNISTCAAIGYHTRHQAEENMSYIFVDEGISNHTIVRGQSLYTKNRVVNGLGHMVVSLDGRKCECGAYGCLETYCSVPAIRNDVRSMLKLGLNSQLRGSADEVQFKDICKAAQNGDPLCQGTIRQAIAVFCAGLTNYVKLLPVDTLVLGGRIPSEVPQLFSQVQEALARQGWKGNLRQDRHIQRTVSLGCHTLLLEQII